MEVGEGTSVAVGVRVGVSVAGTGVGVGVDAGIDGIVVWLCGVRQPVNMADNIHIAIHRKDWDPCMTGLYTPLTRGTLAICATHGGFLIPRCLHVYLLAEIKMKRLHVLLIVTFLLTGCTASTVTPTPPLPPTGEIQTTLPEPTDPTQLIAVRSGETFDLVLPSNPSTGYHWDILPELDTNLVEFVQQNYFAEQPVLPGSGGVESWTFRALSAGETTVVLGYYPPDTASEPEEVVTFSVRVE